MMWSFGGFLLSALVVLVVVVVGWRPDDRLWPQAAFLALAALMILSILGTFGVMFILKFLFRCPGCGKAFGLGGPRTQHSRSCENCGLVIPNAIESVSGEGDLRVPTLRNVLHWPFRLHLTLGRLCLAVVFAAPFLAVGAASAILAAGVLQSHNAIAHWASVEGQLTAVEFRPGEDPCVEFTYQVQGVGHRGRTFSPARCRTSDYWARMETGKLRAALGRPRGIVVYYDPVNPADSCLYRENAPAWTNLFATAICIALSLLLFLAALLDVPRNGSPSPPARSSSR